MYAYVQILNDSISDKENQNFLQRFSNNTIPEKNSQLENSSTIVDSQLAASIRGYNPASKLITDNEQLLALCNSSLSLDASGTQIENHRKRKIEDTYQSTSKMAKYSETEASPLNLSKSSPINNYISIPSTSHIASTFSTYKDLFSTLPVNNDTKLFASNGEDLDKLKQVQSFIALCSMMQDQQSNSVINPPVSSSTSHSRIKSTSSKSKSNSKHHKSVKSSGAVFGSKSLYDWSLHQADSENDSSGSYNALFNPLSIANDRLSTDRMDKNDLDRMKESSAPLNLSSDSRDLQKSNLDITEALALHTNKDGVVWKGPSLNLQHLLSTNDATYNLSNCTNGIINPLSTHQAVTTYNAIASIPKTLSKSTSKSTKARTVSKLYI